MRMFGLSSAILMAAIVSAEIYEKWNSDPSKYFYDSPEMIQMSWLDLKGNNSYLDWPQAASKTGQQPKANLQWNPELSDNDKLRYKRMAKWAAAAYCREESILSWSCGPRCQGNKHDHKPIFIYFLGITQDTYVVLYFKSTVTETVGFVAVYTDLQRQEENIIISFRGAKDFAAWIQNVRSTKEPSPWPDKENPGTRVHTSFLDYYSDIAATVRSAVMVLTKRYPSARIIVNGHSLGGAIATLCAADLKFHLGWSARIELVTFHAPRVGNLQFANFMSYIFQTAQAEEGLTSEVMTRRFTNRDDPVPSMPPAWLEFCHTTQEIWVNLNDQTQVCNLNEYEDPNCSRSVLNPSDLNDHFQIWDVNFGNDCSV